jgi:2-polyprenyl-3-methyl-5-hydroxy-6-metoxy-1,4-benzoquinol methylase
VHLDSAFYDVESFKRGRNSLRPLEREELGDVTGRSLLHLQCHFGMDTLSWARLAAQVTGVDFSEEAITQARALAAELGLEPNFVCANVYDLPMRRQTISSNWIPHVWRWPRGSGDRLAPVWRQPCAN